jgi:hypothetical protein
MNSNGGIMNDHNKRIQKQLLDAAKNLETKAENIVIEEMERKVEPLTIMVAALMIALIANSALEAYAAYKYKSQIDAANVFASCLNGQQIEIGDSWARCKVKKLTLVSGIRQ